MSVHEARKWFVFLHPFYVRRPAQGEPIRISGWNLTHKNKSDGATEDKICIILISIFFDWSIRVTDRETDGRTGDSISRVKHNAVAR